MLSPLPEYNEGKIFCSYEQFDTDDVTTLFEPVEVHEQIEVDYILPASTELREIPSAVVRSNTEFIQSIFVRQIIIKEHLS